MNKKQNIIPTNAEGKYHGLCIRYHPNGNISTKQMYVNGYWGGICEWYMSNGDLWSKEYRIKGKYLYYEWYGNINQIRFKI